MMIPLKKALTGGAAPAAGTAARRAARSARGQDPGLRQVQGNLRRLTRRAAVHGPPQRASTTMRREPRRRDRRGRMSPCGIRSRQRYPRARRLPSRFPAAAIPSCCSTRWPPSRPRAVTRSRRIHVHHGLSAERGRVGAVLRRALRRTARRLRAFAASMSSALPRASLEAHARRARYAALAAAARDRGPASSRSRTIATTRPRRCCCSCCAARSARAGRDAGVARRTPTASPGGARCSTCRARDIDAYAIDRSLRWVDDESNADRRHARNAVRHSVLPALCRSLPTADATLARAAAHQADAARLARRTGATATRRRAFDGEHAAARGVRHALAAPRAQPAALVPARPGAAGAVDRAARRDARPAARRARRRRHPARARGRRDRRASGQDRRACRAADALRSALARRAGTRACRTAIARVRPCRRRRHRRSRGSTATVRVRSRAGGERFQVASDRPRRALKSVLRDAGIPPWERGGLPLVYCGDALAAVAGLGIDAAARARARAARPDHRLASERGLDPAQQHAAACR